MYQPQTYAIALTFMIISMLCWGSWANTIKLCPQYRFQLFYWDYVIGLILGTLVWGLTLGALGNTGRPFLQDILASDTHHIGLAVIGGIIFNVANLLLVAAIDIAGLAVAFPVGIGLALVVGAVSSYILAPAGNPLMLFGGIALVVTAIVLDAAAYRLREAERQSISVNGVVLSLVAGLLMGCFYPFRFPRHERCGRAWSLRHVVLFRAGRRRLCPGRQFTPDASSSGWETTGKHQRLYPRAWDLACVGNPRRHDLVHRRSPQFHRLPFEHRGSRSLLLHWTRRHHDLRGLGSLHLA